MTQLNYTASLLVLLDKVSTIELEMVSQERIVLDAMDSFNEAKDIYQEVERNFRLTEASLTPPGGGRWNDNKREIYIREQWDDETLLKEVREKQLIREKTKLKCMTIIEKSLGRQISIFQMLVSMK